CGHPDATAEEAEAPFDLGVRTVTHLFNAMRPFRHRDPGIAGAALARDDVIVQVILDGVHLAPETANVVWRSAAGRVALVTDAMAGAGLGDGAYRLGGLDIEIEDGVARGPDGELAGSTLTMLDAVRNLHVLGASFEEAVGAATDVPARVLRNPTVGRLAVGLPADIGGRHGPCRPLRPPHRQRARPARAFSPRSTSSQRRSSGFSSATRTSRASRRRSRSARQRRSAWSGTGPPTTRPPTASTRSGSSRAGQRCATRSR
ncbi:MAG: hypothetical protein E6G20_10275, partial [Actinobacteria bacterium]